MTPLKANTIISSILLLILLMLPYEAMAQRRRVRELKGPVVYSPPKNDSLRVDTLKNDTLKANVLKADTLSAESVKKKKQPLDAPVVYSANDSIVFTQGGFAHLYGDGKVNYENIELGAEIITMNMDSSTVYARGVIDSVGVEKGKPVFKDGETPYETKAIRYNFKSKKGFINNVVTQQGEGYVVGNNAKKGANDELFMENGRYTTCDHHDHPHFYMQLTKAKVRPKKNVVTGPAYLVVEDVPLPLAVPFFFFPFSSSYSSGFVMPSYMDDSSRGFGLTGGGYYFAVSDLMDLKLTADIFTKGSWAANMETNYNKRYKYSGSLQAGYQVTKLGDKGMPDYSVAKDFKIVWNHRQDQKASPNSTFSASVNFATSSYERTNINNLYNSQLMTQNTKTSSVSYSRSFPDQKLTLAGTFNIAQTMRDSSIAVTLPDLNITLRYYPALCAYGHRFVDLEDAEEIVQDSLLWIWENRENLFIETSLSSYLFKMIYRKALNKLAHIDATQRADTRFYEEMQEMLQDTDLYQVEELTQRIKNAIAILPESYREAFVMHRFRDMSYKEIAEILGVSPKTVDYRIQQALKQLRIDLKDYLPLLLPILFP